MRRALVAVLVVLSACGGDDPPKEPARAGPPVVVHGTIEEIARGAACKEEAGRMVVWYDATDRVLASVTASRRIEHDFEGRRGACRIADAYEVTVPREVFYTMEIVGISGRVGPVSLDRLRDWDYTLDVSISED